MSFNKKTTLYNILMLAILLAKLSNCDEYVHGGDGGRILRFYREMQNDPEKVINRIQTKSELRKNLDKIMNQRRKQLAYESFWELRRG